MFRLAGFSSVSWCESPALHRSVWADPDRGLYQRSGSSRENHHLLVEDASVIGCTLGGLKRYNPKQNAKNSRTLMGWLASGRIHPLVSRVMKLDDVIEAYQLLVDRKAVGKVILT